MWYNQKYNAPAGVAGNAELSEMMKRFTAECKAKGCIGMAAVTAPHEDNAQISLSGDAFMFTFLLKNLMEYSAELQGVQPLRIAVLLAVYFAGIENDDIDENAGLIFGNAFKRAANAVRRELDVQQKRHNEFARSMKNGK